MKRTLILAPTAAKQLATIGTTTRLWLEEKLAELALDPARFANNTERLHGQSAGLLKTRFGGWRVIYSDSGVVLLIVKIGARGGVYKGKGPR